MRKVGLTAIVTAIALTLPGGVEAKSTWHLGIWSPGYHNVENAIYYHFCGKRYRYCYAGAQAMTVSKCETGGTFSVWADNGQYLGLFQMGSSERAHYGHGNNPWAQSRAAHAYYVAAGSDWSPWECKPTL